jgi:ATP-dependent DNA helicase RecQ
VPDLANSPTVVEISPAQVADVLARRFGHRAFRPGQEPIVQCALEGRDLLAVMPTGAGKSLCYQLPALMLPGLTLVVSPLISLIKDQVDELRRRGVAAFALHSMQSDDARWAIIDEVRAGRAQLLYVAPERFTSAPFLTTLATVPLARFIVDEAHCVSQWGHDFRPDYRRLAEAASLCRRADAGAGRPPMLAFTATATPEVRDDIVSMLGLDAPRLFVAGFDRPNIEMHVIAVEDEDDKQARLPLLVGGQRAIVYCATRRRTEQAAATLVDAGIAAAAYHAGLPDRARADAQDDFASGKARVVAATNAFGMGIDRPDVEAVVHADIPGSVEAYYQEIGRAGRDGRPATATLLWQRDDVQTREFLIDKAKDPVRPGRTPLDPVEAERRRALDHLKLQRMVGYAESTNCLRATILRYFGDPEVREPCGACGNCLGGSALGPGDVATVRAILTGIAEAGERYGRQRITAMLRGATEGLPDSLTRLPSTGRLRRHLAYDIYQWIESAVDGGLIVISQNQYRTLSLTSRGRDVAAGRVSAVRLQRPEPLRLPQTPAPWEWRHPRRRR